MKNKSIEPSNQVVFDPLSDAYTANPYPILRRLRDEEPMHYSARNQIWVVSRYEDVKYGLSQHEMYSSETPPNNLGPMCPAAVDILKDRAPIPPTLVTSDPPTHTNNRRSVHRLLSPRRLSDLDKRIRYLASSLIDAFVDRGYVEFVSEFSGPLPLAVVSELLGIPADMRGQFRIWADLLKTGHSAELTEQQQISLANANMEIDAYLRDLISMRRRQPRGDLLSDLTTAVRPNGLPFEDQEILGIALQLAVAGHETTTSVLTGLMLILATHSELARSLREDASGIEAVVEEGLRYFSPVQGRFRKATTETFLRETKLAKGERVLFSVAAANHDERAFTAPENFDPSRANVKEHLAFGHGIHFCIGAGIARLELRIAIELLLAAMKDIRVAKGAMPHWGRHFNLRGLERLEVEFDPIA